jgi:DNA-binding PadR family transcriptional regulator
MAIGEFEYLLLAVASSLQDEAYGASIRKRLLEDGQPRSIGAIHTGLDRLQAKGLIVTRMGEPTSERGGRAKRMVKVTAAGARAAADFYKMISVASRDVQWAEISR